MDGWGGVVFMDGWGGVVFSDKVIAALMVAVLLFTIMYLLIAI